MEHANLLSDLGVVLIAAGCITVLFRYLKLPVIFGYLMAGILLGPNLFSWSLIHNLDTINQLSELGVVLLLFFLGIEFDLRRMRKVLGSAFMALVVQTVGMIYLARLFAPMLGWDGVSSLFFGCLLAISSSMVTIRVLTEQKRMHLPHAQLAVGLLIMEDILAVLMLVTLTGVAVTRQFDWDAVILVCFVMAIFVVMVFLVGRVLAPKLLAMIGQSDSDEPLTVFSLGFLLAISMLAQQLELSIALGAFLAGAIFSQTQLAQRIETSQRSLHDLFTAIFFVTIGMLINPFQMLADWKWILLLSVLVILVKIITCWAGFYLSAQPSRSSFRAAVAKAQIGEFSFVIAQLGFNLGVTDERLTTLTFGIALISILVTPLITARSLQIFEGITARTPQFWVEYALVYRTFLETLLTSISRNSLLRLIKRPVIQITLYFLVVNGILAIASWLTPYVNAMDIGYPELSIVGIWLVAGILLLPFSIAIIRNVDALVMITTEVVFSGRNASGSMIGKLRYAFNTLALLGLLLFIGFLVLLAAAPHLPKGIVFPLFCLFVLLFMVLFWRKMIRVQSQLEHLFIESFHSATHDLEAAHKKGIIDTISKNYPWQVHVFEYTLLADTYGAHKRIADLKLREQTGCVIVAVGRGQFWSYDPHPATHLFPGDRLLMLGEEGQQMTIEQLLSTPVLEPSMVEQSGGFQVEKLLVQPGTFLDGNTLAASALRRQFQISVIGIQRGAQRITAPGGNELIRAGDLLLVVGNKEQVAHLNLQMGIDHSSISG
jgi:CPA2 family monovalent cation:H+ antiporter-2